MNWSGTVFVLSFAALVYFIRASIRASIRAARCPDFRHDLERLCEQRHRRKCARRGKP
ncbi:MAG: hypothetical protein LAN84_00305 [Acidobacteriia bacterium]|nr:hypothetical protein [Terriglobia bacterium]